MNQQTQEPVSSTPSNVPMKRKRGRPRKVESAVQGGSMPVVPGSGNLLSSNQTASTTDDCDDQLVGKTVTGVIEGTFNAGYLLSVQVADTDTCLRGLVFLPGRVAPVTAENDVAPHLRMVERKEIPIPVLIPQTEIHGSAPSSGQCIRQPFEPNIQVPMAEDQVLPTELHSGISVSLENQSASTVVPIVPMVDIAKNETSICTGGIPQGISEPGHESHSASIMSDLENHEPVKRDLLHELDASRQSKESSTDGGATEYPEAEPEPINLVATIEITNKELRTVQQDVPSVHKLNEPIYDEPKRSNIELNQIPVSAEPESMPSEKIRRSVDNFMEKQASPKTDVIEDTKTKLTIETLSQVEIPNSNERPSTGVANIVDVGSNHALETSQPQFMSSEQISKFVPFESKFTFFGSDFKEKSDPPNRSSFAAAVDKVNVNQPTESLIDSVKSENQIGSDNS